MKLRLALLIGLLGIHAAASAVTDATDDLLPTFAGSYQAALDITSADVTFDTRNQTFTLLATAAGSIADATNVGYVFGFNTGAAANAPFASLGFPNIRFDSTALLRSDSVGLVAGSPVAVSIVGDSISATFDAALLPSKGFSSSQYQFAVWSIETSVAGSARNADFAPKANILVSSVPEPQTYALMLCGLASVAGMARRKRA